MLFEPTVVFNMASVTDKLATNNSSAGKGTHKRKKSGKKKPADDASTASPIEGSGSKRRNSFEQYPYDEPAVKNLKQSVDMRAAQPIIALDGLCRPGKATQDRMDETPQQAEKRLAKMCGAVTTLLECVGEDFNREGLQATPMRYAKALLFLTKGYQVNINELVNNALFHEGHNEMVVIKDVEIYSLCEHHLVPFTGKVNAGQSVRILLAGTNQKL